MSSGSENSDPDLLELLEALLEKEDIHDIKVVSNKSMEKGEGFTSEIKFVDVIGKTNKGEKCVYNLVIKNGKTNESFRQMVPVRSFYEHEICAYKNIIPAFQNILKENNQPPFDHVPKCFSTILEEDKEYLALENLKGLGYDIHDKNICMNQKHFRATLEVYAKWHSLSFVLKDQERKKFDGLSSKLNTIELFKPQEETLIKLLTEAKEFDLLERFKAKYSSFYDNWSTLLKTKEPESVITHGDCWNNNFLFKYKPADKLKENPLHVVLLDFQFTCLGSPVLDLSYHLFTVCSGKDMNNLKELLDLYYTSLAENIRKMGSDPDKLFPYSSLIAHWKKYHFYGFMMAMMVIPTLLVGKEDIESVENVTDFSEEERSKILGKTKVKREDRLIPLIRHAVEYEL